MSPDFQPPPSWRARLAGYAATPQTIGESGARVFRLVADAQPTLFAKAGVAGTPADPTAEVARLRWLYGACVACSEVLAFDTGAGHRWVLMTALPGRDAVAAALPPERKATLIGGALRGLHAMATASCPFDARLDVRLADAHALVAAGLVDEGDFDDERRGWKPRAVLERVLETRPTVEDAVVTHGDACLPNLMLHADAFAGFVDCGRVGIADRHQDLALACRSISHNLGAACVEPFLAAYGIAPDPARLAFYQLLDELF